MTRTDLQKLSRVRLQEARLLLQNNYYSGAYYLTGYAIESALKAAIAKQVCRHDFPDKDLAQKSFSHDLQQLLRIAGLEPQLNADAAEVPALGVSWAVVKDWRVDSRYNRTTGAATAKDMYSATVTRSGILTWIRKRW